LNCARKDEAKSAGGAAPAVVTALLAKSLELNRAQNGAALCATEAEVVRLIQHRMNLDGLWIDISQVRATGDEPSEFLAQGNRQEKLRRVK
jgi:hypothetical protein